MNRDERVNRAGVRFVTCAELPAPDPDTPRRDATLEAQGVHVDIADWRAADVDSSDTPLTVVRSPWDYVDAYDDFLAWIRATGAVTDLWNPPALLEWNVHKSYLLDLADARGTRLFPRSCCCMKRLPISTRYATRAAGTRSW